MWQGWRRPQQINCCRIRDETWELDLEEQRQWWKSSVGLPISLACSAGVFTENTCWCLSLGYLDELGEGRKVGGVLLDSLGMGMGTERKGRLQWGFCHRAGWG